MAAIAGAVLLVVFTLLHPLGSDPADAPAAFAEYAVAPFYVWSHLGRHCQVGRPWPERRGWARLAG
jgi:hypothetical protein